VKDQCLPPIPITNEDLDPQLSSEKLVKIVAIEWDSPACVSVPFNAMPTDIRLLEDRFAVTISRQMTPRAYKDIDELRNSLMDIRQVFSDNALKDLLAIDDASFFASVDMILMAPNAVVPTSGEVQYKQIFGSMTPTALTEADKILPSTPSNLEGQTHVVNQITIKDIMKNTSFEMGNETVQDVMKDGWTRKDIMGRRYVVTNKKDIVPTNTMYMFAAPKALGKSYELQQPTMYIKREAFMLEFFVSKLAGLTIANTNAVARVDFIQ